MTDLTADTILRLFWHRTRREFVPLTTTEIVNRTKRSIDDVHGALNRMVRQGQLTGDTTTGTVSIYDTTAIGQLMARAAMMGEAS